MPRFCRLHVQCMKEGENRLFNASNRMTVIVVLIRFFLRILSL